MEGEAGVGLFCVFGLGLSGCCSTMTGSSMILVEEVCVVSTDNKLSEPATDITTLAGLQQQQPQQADNKWAAGQFFTPLDTIPQATHCYQFVTSLVLSFVLWFVCRLVGKTFVVLV